MREKKSNNAPDSKNRVWSGLKGSSISFKILIVTQVVTITVLLVSGIISFIMSRDAIEEKIFDQLTSVRELKGQQIESYVESINLQIITLSEDPTIQDAMYRLGAAFDMSETSKKQGDNDTAIELNLLDYYSDEYFTRLQPNTSDNLSNTSPSDFIPTDPAATHLQHAFISNNPHPTGMKHKLDSAGNDLYSRMHEKFHPILRSYLEKFGYYDIFLINHETGEIVYSVFKEVDFATSLLTGPYSKTNFAQAFKNAASSNEKDFVSLVDFEPYYPSYNAPASFITSPIFDGNRKIGVLAFQMPIERINDIMTSNHDWKNVGLGDSGETYIVGSDFTMRNQSRFLFEDATSFVKAIRNTEVSERVIDLIKNFGTSIGLLPVETEGTKAALSGITDTGVFSNYRGVSVFSSYRPLSIENVTWVIMSEIDRSEALAPIDKLKDQFLLTASILIAIGIYIAFFFSRSITVSLVGLTARAERLAEGELDEPVVADSGDEIGKLASSFERMRQSIRKLVDDLQGEKDALEGRVKERTEELDEAFHRQEQQTLELEKKNSEMLKVQEELQQSEKEQTESKERIDSILQASPDGICVINAEGNIIMVNNSLQDVFGYSAEEVMGMNVKMLMPDDMTDKHHNALERVVWGRETKIIGKGATEVKGRTKAGKIFPMELSVSQINSGNESIFVGIIRNITDRVKMQQDIEEKAAFQAALLDAVPNPIFVKDSELRFTAINRAYEEAFGIRREDYIGSSTLEADYVPDAVRQDWQTSDQKLINEGGFKREEVVARFVDQQDHDVLSMRRTFELEGGVSGGMLGILIDISDRKEMEREMESAREQAESASKAKSAFLANMSHELRTPMNAIIGYAEILKEDAEDEENDEIIPDLDKIATAGRHLLQLINDVLDISKVESGHMDMYLEDFDIAEMIEGTAATINTLVEKNNNVLEISIEENIGRMHADVTKVRQMVFNLVSNAAKFTSDGKITIEANTANLNGRPFIRLSVKDTGIGIPEDKLDHIFEEFSQADSSTTRNYGGTGLGLALVRKFSEMMGGTVRVESEPGKGSSFILEIPVLVVDDNGTKTAQTTENSNNDHSQTASLGKILVIDDDANARQLLKRILEQQGYSVITAEDGEQGLSLAKSEKPAAITCDILMPNIDGWEVLQRLKDDQDTQSIPVIMISMLDDGKQGAALGAVEHLRKPVNREQLQSVISRYVKAADTVMIVEDDTATQEVTSKALSAMGIETIIANNGKEALDILNSQWPDLLLLDLMMPVMDGFEFLKHFRKFENADTLPVIVVTAKDLTAEDRETLHNNVAGIIEKEEDYIKDLIRNVGMAVGNPDGTTTNEIDS